MGRAIHGRRDPVQLATRFSIDPSAGDRARRIRGARDYMLRSRDASPLRLGVEENVGAMAELVTAGRVRHLGLSEVDGELPRRAHTVHPITAMQSEYPLWTRDVETVTPMMAELRVGSRGGLSAKIHLASDARARPLALVVTAGQAGDTPAFTTVMAAIRVPRTGPGRPRPRPDTVIADRAYSARAIRSHLRERHIRAVIPQPVDQIRNRLRRGSRGGRPPGFDTEACKERNAVERCIGRLKQWRGGLAMRTDNLPSPTRPHSTLPPSSSGPADSQNRP